MLSLRDRYGARAHYLHGDCFYDGHCEPEDVFYDGHCAPEDYHRWSAIPPITFAKSKPWPAMAIDAV